MFTTVDFFGEPCSDDSGDEGYDADPFASSSECSFDSSSPHDLGEEEADAREVHSSTTQHQSPVPPSPRPSFCAPPLPSEQGHVGSNDEKNSFEPSLMPEAFDLLLSEATPANNSEESAEREQHADVSMAATSNSSESEDEAPCLTLDPKDHSYSLSAGTQPMSLLQSLAARTSSSPADLSGQHGVIGEDRGDDSTQRKEEEEKCVERTPEKIILPKNEAASSARHHRQTSLDWWLVRDSDRGARSSPSTNYCSMTDTDAESDFDSSAAETASLASATTDDAESDYVSPSSSASADLYESDSATSASGGESCAAVAHLSFELAAADLRSDTDASDNERKVAAPPVIGMLPPVIGMLPRAWMRRYLLLYPLFCVCVCV